MGKGRICASIMRYAQQQGKIALFITKDKPPLRRHDARCGRHWDAAVYAVYY